jgi:hypothetical protein
MFGITKLENSGRTDSHRIQGTAVNGHAGKVEYLGRRYKRSFDKNEELGDNEMPPSQK